MTKCSVASSALSRGTSYSPPAPTGRCAQQRPAGCVLLPPLDIGTCLPVAILFRLRVHSLLASDIILLSPGMISSSPVTSHLSEQPSALFTRSLLLTLTSEPVFLGHFQQFCTEVCARQRPPQGCGVASWSGEGTDCPQAEQNPLATPFTSSVHAPPSTPVRGSPGRRPCLGCPPPCPLA